MAQLSYFPMLAVAVTGSEGADSHKGTMNLDLSYQPDPWVLAPFDCRLVQIYHSATINSNTTWFESLTPVQGKSFTDYMTFYVGHMNNADLAALGLKAGNTYKQGQRIYKAGNEGAPGGTHVHISWGRGKFTGIGWNNNNVFKHWRINNQVHVWDACYLRPGTQIIGQSNPAGYAYKPNWAYAPAIPVVVTANMVATVNKGVKTGTTQVRVRSTPDTSGAQVALLPINSTLPITQMSTNQIDGFTWIKVKVGAIEGYSALVASIKVVDVAPPTTPLEDAQAQLVEANKRVMALTNQLTALTVQSQTLTSTMNALKIEVASFKPVTKVVYEKV